MTEERKLVFISHGNPEDNSFTLWLASRLTSLGYLVWSDVTQLFGAEKFWRDIEDAIRNHAAKVIVVLSQTSQAKEGVLNEIHTALAVEKKDNIDRFVVPIRIDDLPPTDITSVLIQKTYIDFHINRADGLDKLRILLEKGNVPRSQSQTVLDTSKWIDQLLAGPQKIVQKPQTILSNWFSFVSLPDNLNFFRVPINTDKIRARFETFSYPVYPYQDMIATFSCEEDINKFLTYGQHAIRAYQLPLQAILSNKPHSLPTLEWQEISRMLSYLIKKAWDNAMRQKGLEPYEISDGRNAWYPINGYSEKNRTYYTDTEGVKRWRKLVGKSKKWNIYWHFAVAAHPFIRPVPYLMLKAHVPFTEDGKELLPSHKRMHSLRRSFCRNWWNDRWRELLLAYVEMVSNKTDGIKLQVGSNQYIQICPQPQVFEMPVSIQGINETPIVKDETDEELDQLAVREGLEVEDDLDVEFEDEENDYPTEFEQ